MATKQQFRGAAPAEEEEAQAAEKMQADAPAPKDTKLEEARALLARHLGSTEMVAALEEFIRAVK